MPYRVNFCPYRPPHDEGYPPTIREVYDAACAAVEYFNRSCPNGTILEAKDPSDLRTEWVSKHGPRFLLTGDPITFQIEFCCQKEWDELWSGQYLPNPWRWMWKRCVKKLEGSMFRETPPSRPR